MCFVYVLLYNIYSFDSVRCINIENEMHFFHKIMCVCLFVGYMKIQVQTNTDFIYGSYLHEPVCIYYTTAFLLYTWYTTCTYFSLSYENELRYCEISRFHFNHIYCNSDFTIVQTVFVQSVNKIDFLFGSLLSVVNIYIFLNNHYSAFI